MNGNVGLNLLISRKSMEIEHKGKIIGKLEQEDGEVVFTKVVNPLKHKMHAFEAYGIQEGAFRKHLKGKDGKVIIKEVDDKAGEKRVLETTINKWENYGFVKDMGAGEQRLLLIDKMKVKKANNNLTKN